MNSIAINPLTGSPAISYLDRTDVHALGYAWYVGSGGSARVMMPGIARSLIQVKCTCRGMNPALFSIRVEHR